MRVALYSPYLDTFGGGEKYMLTIAETFSQNHQVDILLDKNLSTIGGEYLKDQLSKRFNLDLSKVKFIKAPLGAGSNFILRTIFLKKYDLFFYLTDGSIFLPSAKKNILHIQSPLIGQPSKGKCGRFKLKGWDLIIYNSKFTQAHSLNNWPLKSKVIYPPVDVQNIKPFKKQKYILSVGRFFGHLRDKKHEVMIKTFMDILKNKKINGWSLHLVGAASKGDDEYLEELTKLSPGYPVKLYPNLSYQQLTKLYGESSIYWHAAGFGEEDPTKMEHFGISTVEAMAGGCVPIVIGKGGQIEIVEDKISGYLWNSLDQLKQLTLDLISDNKLREDIAKRAITRSTSFSKEKFVKNIIDLAS